MELYLLKFSCILGVLLAFYKLLLERQDMQRFNRFYLLGSLTAALSIPLVSFPTYMKMPVQEAQLSTEIASSITLAPETTSSVLPLILSVLFAAGVFFFSIRFARNLYTIWERIHRNQRIEIGPITNVLLREDLVPHTFLDYIFLNKKKFETKEIPVEVLEHEKAHALQKHSWDILFLELIQTILWFHPLVYLLKKEVRLNHEFLADKAVLRQGISARRYQQTLLSFSSNTSELSLVHPINYSSIKKRITVMKTKSSKTAIQLRSLLVLPLLAVLLYSFSSKEIHYTSEDLQEVATKEMIKEYNDLAAHYNAQKKDYYVVRLQDFARMRHIWNLMSPAQKEKAEKFPSEVAPPPPPPPAAPQKGDGVPAAPPPPPAPKERSTFDISKPLSPPPAPPSPAELIKQVAAEGATFWLNDREIDAAEALELVQSKKKVSIKVVDHTDFAPTVIISTD